MIEKLLSNIIKSVDRFIQILYPKPGLTVIIGLGVLTDENDSFYDFQINYGLQGDNRLIAEIITHCLKTNTELKDLIKKNLKEDLIYDVNIPTIH
jgi:hypothetical protein